MNRRMIPFALAALAGGGALQAGLDTKKGVTLNVRGQMMALVVMASGDHFGGRAKPTSQSHCGATGFD